jgi:hypothetical protein
MGRWRRAVGAGLVWGLAGLTLVSGAELPKGGSVSFHFEARKMGLTVLAFSLSVERREPGYCITAAYETRGILRPFLRMHNVVRSIVKEGGLEPVTYEQHIDQQPLLGKAERFNKILYFFPRESKVLSVRDEPRRTFEATVPPRTRDPLSLFLEYYLGAEVRAGDRATLPIHDGQHLRSLAFSAARDEVATSLFGRVRTIRVETQTFFKTFQGQEGTIKIWYTDDERRIPVQIDIDLPATGLVRLVLVKLETDGGPPVSPRLP